MVWVGIPLGGQTDLHVFQGGTLTGVRYRDEILDPYVCLYAGASGNDFILMDDNARPHRAVLVEEYLGGLVQCSTVDLRENRNQVLRKLLLAENDEESVAAFTENMKDACYMKVITGFVQSIPGFQECDEDVDTWKACDAEDCGFQILNDDEISTSVQEESDPVVVETDEDEDNNESGKGPSNNGAFSTLRTAMEWVSSLFTDKEDNEESDKVIQKLENIDDEADAKNIGFVKIADENLAIEYGLDTLPALIYYRKKIPLLFDGDLLNEEEVLNYLFEFQDLGEESEAIEDVSANSLIQLIEESRFLAVLFYDIESRRSQRILEELENIDDDALRHGIPFVKIEDRKLASEYGIETLPTLVYFENKMPNFYQGDLTKEEDVLDWLVKQANSDEIEDVTDRVLQHMIKRTHELVVLFYSYLRGQDNFAMARKGVVRKDFGKLRIGDHTHQVHVHSCPKLKSQK
ncbi:thioredoxin domain-containing protein [Trichonephila clavipes]|nr:thioredoxin domain-containing protein [Trichonephila clavipes]